MSGAEEYLDGLLHSVEGGSPADTARETEPGDTADGLYAEKEQETKKAGMSEEDDFLKSFEADTDLEGDADTFIRQFEDELDQAPREERTQKTTEENNQFFKDLDGILDSARDADESTGGAEAAETAHASEDGDLMVDTIGDFQDDDSDLMDLLQSEGDFPDMSQIYDLEFQKIARKAAASLDIDLMEGVYLQLTGPQYESPQEIAMCRTLGADAVGMSTACEAIAARHMGMRVIGISCITNLAAGISPQPLCHAEVQEAADMVAPQFKKLVAATIQGIAKTL